MGSYALAFPVLPGKSDADIRGIAKMFTADPAAYRAARKDCGITLERAYLQRGKGMAFTAPVAPGETDAGRAFAKEAFQKRMADFAASRRALGQTVELITLQPTPQGDVINVYLEGADPSDANRRFAASQSPFDAWFKSQLREIFPPFVDFGKPVPGVEEIFDSESLKVTA